MANKSLTELTKLLKDKQIKLTESLKNFEGDSNPQVKEIYFRITGELNMLEDILHYTTKGSKVFLTD